MIRISPSNPIRFKGSLDYEFIHNEFKCYMQKYNLQDVTNLQVLSDEEEAPVLTVRRSSDGSFVKSYIFTQVAENIVVDENFSVFEAEIIFSDLGIGEFYLEFNSAQQSNTIQVKHNHEDTILLKYRNSYNKFGIIFDTDIVFYTRVEGTIRNYEPKSNDEIYNDQVMNASKLFSIPYNIFTLFIGGDLGIPDYMIDLVNRIFSCDMIKIDDYWFEKVEGAEWSVERIDDYPFSVISINIMPAINNIAEQIRIDEGEDLEPSETMIIQRYSNNYQDATGSIEIQNIFEKNSVLNYIRVYRKSDPYTIRVGTTPGGNEIVECDIQNILHTINLNHTFNNSQTVYVSGLVGSNDISLVWDKVDRFFNPGSSSDVTPQPAETLGIGAIIEWHGSMVDLEDQFNLVTGLGRDTGDWIGWAICDGENGTPDARGRVSIGWKRNDTNYGTVGHTAGSDNVKITRQQLPNFRIKLFANEARGSIRSSDINSTDRVAKEASGGGRAEGYSLARSGQEATVGTSEAIGNGHDFSIVQSHVVLLKIKKVF